MNPWNPRAISPHPCGAGALSTYWPKEIKPVHPLSFPVWKLNGERYPTWYKITTHHSKKAVEILREILKADTRYVFNRH